ncbi:CHAP domain-containing protein [Lichenicoccus roseus]|uniref:CHAP domain-containing protein n=1 Tax=Lichenicoccus roseus TaxID=2683649 RepID=A0A5R9J5P3_9PROT|nr:CHAP domain-containing protein [Lichenicoccus roseus]
MAETDTGLGASRYPALAVGWLLLLLALSGCGGGLQCAPYARRITGVALSGDAGAWWGEAAGRYVRVRWPEPGAILVFRATGRMPAGHVSVVRRVLDSRTILVEHANWEPGRIDRAAPVRDVSRDNDWTLVRVWWRATRSLGTRPYPTYGFILPWSMAHPARNGGEARWTSLGANSACMATPGEPCPADTKRMNSPAGGKRV